MWISPLTLIAALCVGQPSAKPNPRCGGLCLQVALGAFELAPKTLDELERSLGTPPSGGYSMRQLADEAEKHGAKTLGVATSLERLRDRRNRYACIALMNPGHFVLLYDLDETNAYLVDPPRSFTLPLDTFREQWSGNALLLSDKPLTPENEVSRGFRWVFWPLAGCLVVVVGWFVFGLRARRRKRLNAVPVALSPILFSLVFAGCAPSSTNVGSNPTPLHSNGGLVATPAKHSLGNVPIHHADEELEVKTVLRNEGDRPIRIGSIRKSCTCTTVSLDATTLQPGGSATLTAKIKLGNLAEPRSSSVVVESDDPLRGELPIVFEWRPVPPLHAVPPAVDWGFARPGEARETTLALRSDQMSLCPRCRLAASCDPSLVSCEVVPESIGAGSRHETKGDVPADRLLGSVRLKVRTSLEQSAVTGHVLVRVVCNDEDRARLIVPITWNVTQAIRILPNRLSFGLVKPGQRLSRTFEIRAADQEKFGVKSIKCEDSTSSIVITKPDDQASIHKIKLEWVAPASLGPWTSSLTIQTDRPGAERLELPVSCVVIASNATGFSP